MTGTVPGGTRRRRLPRLALGALALGLAACASAPARPPEPRPSGTGTVDVTVKGVTHDGGQVLVALFLDERGWPNEETAAFGAEVLPIRDGGAKVTFENVPAGPFAVSVFHDEDSDRELDSGLFGIPTEDYGFSRDARDMFGPPGFEEARLELAAGETLPVTVHVE